MRGLCAALGGLNPRRRTNACVHRAGGETVREHRKTDRQRVIIYCNAVKAWSLSGDVDGETSSFMAMAGRKKAMTDRLESEALSSDCRNLTTTRMERWDV